MSIKELPPTPLCLEGMLTIERSREIRDLLQQAIEEEDTLVVDLSHVKGIDLSFIQLLYALRKEAEEDEKTVRLTGPVQQRIKDIFLLAGCEDLL